MPGDAVLLRTFTSNRQDHDGNGRRKLVSKEQAKEQTKKNIKWEILSGWENKDTPPCDDVFAVWVANRKENSALGMKKGKASQLNKTHCLEPCSSIDDYDNFVNVSLSDVLRCNSDSEQVESNTNNTVANENKPVLTQIAKWTSRHACSEELTPDVTTRPVIKQDIRAVSAAPYIDLLHKSANIRCNSATALMGVHTRGETASPSSDADKRSDCSQPLEQCPTKLWYDNECLETASKSLASRTAEGCNAREAECDQINNTRTVKWGTGQQSNSVRSRSAVNSREDVSHVKRHASSAHGVLKLAREVLQSRPQSTPMISTQSVQHTPSTMRFTKGKPAIYNDSSEVDGTVTRYHAVHKEAPTLNLKTVRVQNNKSNSESTMVETQHRLHYQQQRNVEQNVVCKQQTDADTAQEPFKYEESDTTTNANVMHTDREFSGKNEADRHDDVLQKLAIPFNNSLAAVREGMKLLRIKEHAQSFSGPAGFRPTKMKTTCQTVKASSLRTKYKCANQRKGVRIRPSSACRPSTTNLDSSRLREMASINEILRLDMSNMRLSRRRATTQMHQGVYCGSQSSRKLRNTNASWLKLYDAPPTVSEVGAIGLLQ